MKLPESWQADLPALREAAEEFFHAAGVDVDDDQPVDWDEIFDSAWKREEVKPNVNNVNEDELRAKADRLREQREIWHALEEEWGSLDNLDEELDGTLWLLGEDKP